ncbi:hypothetical protein ACRYCC_03515 [Actinomadura scrupuli]|uniref:hypothetical protein n=1 Tax=Actinomadura scrupuli TaxID=559629 RepID=UPI003D98F921
MQLPRVIIAAVFFVIGALIAIPALTRSASSSRADSTPASSSTLTPTATVTAGSTPQVSATASASAKSATPTRTPTRQVTRTVRPTPSHVTPRITVTPKVPTVVPLKATVSAVRCAGPEITVKVTNSGVVTEDYTIEQDGQVALADRVGPLGTRSNPLMVKEGQVTKIVVTWRNKPIQTVTRTVDCATEPPARKSPPENLPRTGADDAELYAKIATGVAAMITGVIIFWWGGVWPRRREDMFAGGRKSSQDSGDKGSE